MLRLRRRATKRTLQVRQKNQKLLRVIAIVDLPSPTSQPTEATEVVPIADEPPTDAPSTKPTKASSRPTEIPTSIQTTQSTEPTIVPTSEATSVPSTVEPMISSLVPTAASTLEPTRLLPTLKPTASSSLEPTAVPSESDQVKPLVPTAEGKPVTLVVPTKQPTQEPTEPYVSPSMKEAMKSKAPKVSDRGDEDASLADIDGSALNYLPDSTGYFLIGVTIALVGFVILYCRRTRQLSSSEAYTRLPQSETDMGEVELGSKLQSARDDDEEADWDDWENEDKKIMSNNQPKSNSKTNLSQLSAPDIEEGVRLPPAPAVSSSSSSKAARTRRSTSPQQDDDIFAVSLFLPCEFILILTG